MGGTTMSPIAEKKNMGTEHHKVLHNNRSAAIGHDHV